MVPSTHMILSIGCAVAWLARARLPAPPAGLRRDKSPSACGSALRATPSQDAVAVFVQTLFDRKLVGRPGLDSADGSDLWFKAHPEEEPMNHSLATVQRGTRRVRATRDHRIKSPP